MTQKPARDRRLTISGSGSARDKINRSAFADGHLGRARVCGLSRETAKQIGTAARHELDTAEASPCNGRAISTHAGLPPRSASVRAIAFAKRKEEERKSPRQSRSRQGLDSLKALAGKGASSHQPWTALQRICRSRFDTRALGNMRQSIFYDEIFVLLRRCRTGGGE